MKRKGQMRIFEALIACSLVLIGHYVISFSSVSTYTAKNVELETIGQNVFNTIEDQDLIISIMSQGENWNSTLKNLLESLLPPDVLFNLTITSLLTNETLADGITNMDPNADYSRIDATTVQGVYTFSYPLTLVEEVLLDVVMVMDRSGSMDDKIPGDQHNKIYYAKEAACNFIDMLKTSDHVGLTSFSTTARIDINLTDNHELVKLRIEDMEPEMYTNIGDGIGYANIVFDNYKRNDATWVIILLSDGMANRPTGVDPAQYARDKAQAAVNDGILIYTIGLGAQEDIDEELLEDIQTNGYFYAPSAEQLNDIYETIAEDLLYEVKYDVLFIKITLMNP